MQVKLKKLFKELTFNHLSPVCESFRIDIEEVRQDIEKILIRTKADDEMIMYDFKVIIVRLFHKRDDNTSYLQVNKDIYDTMNKLKEPADKVAFASKLVGVGYHASLLYLIDEYEKEKLALEKE
ncbi:hypothetical protein PDQ34_26905 [Bacillus cereus]|nr:hypothetical protein [Bacillus cereus]MDA2572743.1 hypothetical protein [Bacillus cereus]